MRNVPSMIVPAPHSVPDPQRGTKGTYLGPRASRGPTGPLGVFLCFIEVIKRKGKKGAKNKKLTRERDMGRKREGERQFTFFLIRTMFIRTLRLKLL